MRFTSSCSAHPPSAAGDAGDAGAGPRATPSLGWSPSLFMKAAGLQGMPYFRRPSFMGRSASFFDQQAAEAEAEAGGSGLRTRTSSGATLRTASGDSLPTARSGSLPPSRRGSLTEAERES